MKNRVLVVGAGFVGGTLYKALRRTNGWHFFIYDKNPQESYLQKNHDLNNDEEICWADSTESAKDADLIFLCLPTPMIPETGECYTGIVEGAVKEIRQHSNSWICIKSTVPPGTTQKLHEQYGNICFNPEFLTEASAYKDFILLPYQIFGFPKKDDRLFIDDCVISELYEDAYVQHVIDAKHHYAVDSSMAEMIKYTRNCYLATRLSFFNEIKQICDKLDIDFDKMKFLAGMDPRIGQHYNRIDKDEPEFSGHCLPKDLNALMFLQDCLGLKSEVLKSAWRKNLEVAKKRTWETMEGRALIKNAHKNDG